MHDVIIAGAGPVGLFLACELRRSGCSVLILEQADNPHAPIKRLPFGMRGLSVPTVEAFDRRGMRDDIAGWALSREGTKGTVAAHWVGQARKPGGHFAGIPFHQDRIDPAQWPYRLPDAATGSVVVDMDSLESALAARAEAMGVEIRRGCRVVDIESFPDGVAVSIGEQILRGHWLVGCDGGRSAVRKLAGFDFVGTEPEFTGYSVEVELAGPDMLHPGRHDTAAGMYTFTPPGTIAMVDFDGGACHRLHPLTREHVQAVLRRVCGKDVAVQSLTLAATWTDRAFQATTYRQGRVLLAGDAAHIHSPLGGQGLNLGIGDAMNLGWKLAATLHGHAPDDLLDTYTSERHPIGARVLDGSRAQVALMRPSPSSRALRAIVGELIDTRDGASYVAGRVWGVSLHHDLGEGHPLVGRSAPDFPLRGGRRLAAGLRTGKAVLLDFEGTAALAAVAARWADRIDYIASDTAQRLGLSALLVRPDGVVAWAADTAPDADEAASVAARWFGEPLGGDAQAA